MPSGSHGVGSPGKSEAKPRAPFADLSAPKIEISRSKSVGLVGLSYLDFVSIFPPHRDWPTNVLARVPAVSIPDSSVARSCKSEPQPFSPGRSRLCLLLALSGHSDSRWLCPLLTLSGHLGGGSRCDPRQTFSYVGCREKCVIVRAAPGELQSPLYTGAEEKVPRAP